LSSFGKRVFISVPEEERKEMFAQVAETNERMLMQQESQGVMQAEFIQ
jgi:hypothetical protein